MRNKILGIPTLLFVLGVVIFGGTASAILVTYLSNTAVTQARVDSPLAVEVAHRTMGDWATYQNLGQYYGGDTVEFDIRTTNRASVVQSGDLDTVISNDATNAACADFTQIQYWNPDTAAWEDITASCVEAGGSITVTTPVSIAATSNEVAVIALTFNNAVAPAWYTTYSTVNV
jgi:hypothetical protein